MRGALVRLALAAVAALAACDERACLAQSGLFESLRPELIEECCGCLAHRGTTYPSASCAEAVVDADGVVVVPPDPDGREIPEDAIFLGDDLNDVVEEGEVPCLCRDDIGSCVQKLTQGDLISVTGACISQGSSALITAPCQEQCKGVLTFDPLAPAD